MLVGVGWCGLVCVRSCLLVGMCCQRCALIVARCACACPCMSARVNACSSTAGLDLTTSSGDHRERSTTPRLCLWCANGRFHPALTCQSAVPGGPSNGKISPLGSSSDDYGSRRAFFLAFSKRHLRRSQNCVYHHDHAVSIGSADRVRAPFPRTGCGKQKPCFKTTGPYETC